VVVGKGQVPEMLSLVVVVVGATYRVVVVMVMVMMICGPMMCWMVLDPGRFLQGYV